MGVLDFSVVDWVLWAVAAFVCMTMFSGILTRRRAFYVKTLRDYVQRSQADDREASGGEQDVT